MSPSTRFVSPNRSSVCLSQSRGKLSFLSSSPGMVYFELLVVHLEGWTAFPWSTVAGDVRDRDSKLLTSRSVKPLLRYCLLHHHGFEHLWSASAVDVRMAMVPYKYSTRG